MELEGSAPSALWNSPAAPCKSDRKSTRLNSSHVSISYAVFCLKNKTSVLMSGNVALLTHASNVRQIVLTFDQLLSRAAFNDGFIHTLLIEPDQVYMIFIDPLDT